MRGIKKYMRQSLRFSGSWRSRKVWFSIASVSMFLFVACGGGDNSSSATDISVPGAAASPSSSKDAAKPFSLELYENANHTRGEVLALSDLAGRPVVVNFWFPSCPPCVAEMPDLDASFQAHQADGIEFIGVQLVGLDSVDDGQKFIDELGVSYALGPDPDAKILQDYKVTGFPTTYFIDSDQNVVKKWTGILDAEKLEELVQQLLN